MLHQQKIALRHVPSKRLRDWLATLGFCCIFMMAFMTVSAVAAHATEIVVYYANETTPQAASSPNTARLLAILDHSTNPAARGMAQLLRDDAAKFGAAVKRNEAALVAAAQQRGFDLIIFSNALALEHKFLVLRHGATLESLPLPAAPPAPTAALATSPLARPEYLATALREIAALYPGRPDVILITNSHGAGDLALTPRIFADLAVTKAGELEHELETPAKPGEPPPVWAAYPGTTKSEYWQVLAHARQLHFALVVRDACESGVSSWREWLALLPADVTTLAHSASAIIDYDAIDFEAAFAADPKNASLATGLAAELQRQGLHVEGKITLLLGLVLRQMAGVPVLLYFVPLALWLCWLGLAVVMAHQRRQAQARKI
jgi:hypothetical protein